MPSGKARSKNIIHNQNGCWYYSEPERTIRHIKAKCEGNGQYIVFFLSPHKYINNKDVMFLWVQLLRYEQSVVLWLVKQRYLNWCTLHVLKMTFIMYTQGRKIGKPNNLNVFGSKLTKDPNQNIQNRLRSSMPGGP